MAHHQHGGNAEKDFKRLGIEPRRYVDFSVNVNPAGPPNLLRKEWPQLFDSLAHYPSQAGEGLAEFYKSRFGIPSFAFLAGNGSTECLYLVPRALRLKKVALPQPSFFDYQKALELAGTQVVPFALKEDENFSYPSLEGWGEILSPVDGVFLGNPNNPTGSLMQAQLLLNLADSFPDKIFMVDQAFVQYQGDLTQYSLISLPRLRKNLLVFHSLTKFYGLPGLRLGALISDPERVEEIAQHQAPWSLSGPAEGAARLLSRCHEYEQESIRRNQVEMAYLQQEIGSLSLFRCYAGQANFLLLRCLFQNLDQLLGFLLQRGLYVRDCRNFAGLEGNFIRIAVLSQAENMRLVLALREFNEKRHQYT